MENRSIGHEGRNESALHQHATVIRQAATSEIGDTTLSGEELHLLIEFFRLLDRWDRQEVVQ
ncbi:MAG: hypothetical protein ACE14M_13325 [Terriglobales bacterium]